MNPISFDTLTEKAEELWIELEGQLYRLRKTKQGKLILTK
ncbi:MAG: hemin uptake protein HemP [Candidatus Moraniibacteriota bacterium]|nr:MAG: hemin uptake protein HemP [Candidatus Moranbacteria bacterium]